MAHPLVEAVHRSTTSDVDRARAAEAASQADAAVGRAVAATDAVTKAEAVADFERAVQYWALHTPSQPLVGWLETQRRLLGRSPGLAPLVVPRTSRLGQALPR